jgi:hypothetical protein
VAWLSGRVGTVAVPGVTIGRQDEDAGVTHGTVAGPGITIGRQEKTLA